MVCITVLPFMPNSNTESLKRLKKDAVYTVEKVVGDYSGNIGLVLKEVKSEHSTGGFYSKRFRPVQDQYSESEIEAVNIDEITKEVEYA